MPWFSKPKPVYKYLCQVPGIKPLVPSPQIKFPEGDHSWFHFIDCGLQIIRWVPHSPSEYLHWFSHFKELSARIMQKAAEVPELQLWLNCSLDMLNAPLDKDQLPWSVDHEANAARLYTRLRMLYMFATKDLT